MATGSTQWARVEAVFDQVVDLSEPARANALAEACGDDEALRREVCSLLAAYEGAAHAIEQVVAVAAETALEGDTGGLTGQHIGPYRVLGLLGEGGMGAVYRAERADQFHMRVAIKVVHRGLGGPELRVRFRDERQILATLDHPSIVRILDGGETAEGQPYLVMEYVDGVPLAEFARPRPVRARLELVLKICAALEYAHSKLVVHRDIKPGNIIVGAEGVPKLLDFGIAKMLEPSSGDRRRRTLTGMAPMTPEYASPEQARGERVTVATDVYSLGAVLFELLVGRPPHEPNDDAFEMLRNICEVDAPRPSVVAPASLQHELSKDLDSIVLRALQKRPADRYPSVAALRQDLQRLLSGHPVLAHDATPGYRMRKFLGRHRVAVSLAFLVIFLLSASTAMSIREAKRADRHAQEAERQTRILLAEQGAQLLENGHHGQALAYLVAALRSGEDTPTVRFRIAEAMRPFEQVIATLRENTSGVAQMTWSPTGERLAISGGDGTVWIYDSTGAPVRKLTGGPRMAVPAFADDSSQLVSYGADSVRVWDVESGRDDFSADLTSRDWREGGLAMSRTPQILGERLAVPMDGEVRIWDLATGQLVLRHVERNPYVPGFALADQGKTVFVGSESGAILALEVATGAQLFQLQGHQRQVATIGLSRDGSRLYSHAIDGSVRVWDLARRAELANIEGAGLSQPVVQPAVSAPETLAVAIGTWGVRLIDLRTGRVAAEHVVTRPVDDSQAGVDVDAAAKLLLSWSRGRFALRELAIGFDEASFELAPLAGTTPHSAGGTIGARFSPDGTRLVAAAGAVAEVRRVSFGPRLARIDTRANGRGLSAAVATAGGQRIATVGIEGESVADVHVLERLEPRAGSTVAEPQDEGSAWRVVAEFGSASVQPWDVSFSPDGQRVVVAWNDRVSVIYDVAGPHSELRLTGHAGVVNRAQFSPDGHHVVTASDDRSARIWNAKDGTLEKSLPHPDRVLAALWSPTGDRIATAGWDGVVRLWNVATGELLQTLSRAGAQFLDVSFSPDGQRVVAATHGGEVIAWSLGAPERPLLLVGNIGPVPTAVFSPDGHFIATAANNSGTIRLFDAATGHLLGQREGGAGVLQASFLPDGRTLLVAAPQGALLFDVHRDERPLAALEAYMAEHVPWRLENGQLELARLGEVPPPASPPP